MSETKENILNVALKLFAHDGYEAVSVSTIAGELGITKGALYRHYKNKRDIFDSIVEKMYEIDEKRAMEYDVPESEYAENPECYKKASIDSVKRYTLAQFEFWTKDVFASNFRKMLVLEQYRNDEMAKLYRECIVFGPELYMERIFDEMMKREILKKSEPRYLALEFYAPFYLLVNSYDYETNIEELREMLEKHIESFFEERAKIIK